MLRYKGTFVRIKNAFREYRKLNYMEFLKNNIPPLPPEKIQKYGFNDLNPTLSFVEKFMIGGVSESSTIRFERISNFRVQGGIFPHGGDPKDVIPSLMIHMGVLEQTIGRYSHYLKGIEDSISDIAVWEGILNGNFKLLCQITKKGGKYDFFNCFAFLSKFILPFKSNLNGSIENHADALLEIFHKEFMDKRWFLIGDDGIPIILNKGSYFMEEKDSSSFKSVKKSKIISVWDFLFVKNHINDGFNVHTGKTYEILGKIKKDSKIASILYKSLVSSLISEPVDIEDLVLSKDNTWKKIFTFDSSLINPFLNRQMKNIIQFLKNFDEYGFTTSNAKNKYTYGAYARHYSFSLQDILKSYIIFVNYILKPNNNQIFLPFTWTRFYNLLAGNIDKLSLMEYSFFQARIELFSFLFGDDIKVQRECMDNLVDSLIREYEKGNQIAYFPNTQVIALVMNRRFIPKIASMQEIPEFFSKYFDLMLYYENYNSENILSSGPRFQIEKIVVRNENGSILKIYDFIASNEEFMTFRYIFHALGGKIQYQNYNEVDFILSSQHLIFLDNIIGTKNLYSIEKNKDRRPWWQTIPMDEHAKKKYLSLSFEERKIARKIIKYSYLMKNMEKSRKYSEQLRSIGYNCDKIIKGYMVLKRWPIDFNKEPIHCPLEFYFPIQRKLNKKYIKMRSDGRPLTHDAFALGAFLEISQYTHFQAAYGDPIQGIKYVGDKMLSIQIGHARGRPMMIICPNKDIKNYYRSQFIGGKSHCAIITKTEFMILVAILKECAALVYKVLGYSQNTNEYLKEFDWLDLIRGKDAFQLALKRSAVALSIPNEFAKKLLKFDEISLFQLFNKSIKCITAFDDEYINFNDYCLDFVSIFDKTLGSPFYDPKFVLFHKIGYVKNEIEFSELLSEFGLGEDGIVLSVNLDEDKYGKSFYLSINKAGNLIRLNNKGKRDSKGSNYKVVYESHPESKIVIKTYKELKKVWYWRFLQSIVL